MEVQLLKEMIEDREQRIAAVQAKLDELAGKEERLASELGEARASNREQKKRLGEERAGMISGLEGAERRLSDLSRDVAQQGSSLRSYASMMGHEQQRVAQSADNTAFVMRMQAQLCKGMHTLGILEHQVELVKRQSEALLKHQRDTVASLTEERSQVELRLMNDLMNVDLGKRDVESELISRLDEIQKEMEATERQIEENRDSDDERSKDGGEEEEEEEDDDDEEEKEAKEELLKLLRERHAEIERLEQEAEQQAEAIEELEGELAEMKENGGGSPSPRSPELRKRYDEALAASDPDDLPPGTPGGGDPGDEPSGGESADDDDDEEEEEEDDDDDQLKETYTPAEYDDNEDTDGGGGDGSFGAITDSKVSASGETEEDAFEDASESMTDEPSSEDQGR